jgi:hypothetical protein
VFEKTCADMNIQTENAGNNKGTKKIYMTKVLHIFISTDITKMMKL